MIPYVCEGNDGFGIGIGIGTETQAYEHVYIPGKYAYFCMYWGWRGCWGCLTGLVCVGGVCFFGVVIAGCTVWCVLCIVYCDLWVKREEREENWRTWREDKEGRKVRLG